MAKNPVFPLYYNDLLGSCRAFTDEELGAYLRLLIYQWDNFGLPLGFDRLNLIAPTAEKNWRTIGPKFVEIDGQLFNERLEEIRAERQKFSEKQSGNGKLGGRPKTQKEPKENPDTKPNNNPKKSLHNEDEDEGELKDKKGTREEKVSVEVWPNFEDFWDAYDKKVGRPKSEKKWEKLDQKTKEKIMQDIPLYKQQQPDKQYRKNPETYLNNEGWNDERPAKKPITGTDTGTANGSDRASNALQSIIARELGPGPDNNQPPG